MTHKPNDRSDPNPPPVYEIRIKGRLDPQWTAWFEGMTIITAENGETILTGPIVDQAALLALLRKIRDLGLPIIAVNQSQPGASQPGARHFN